MTADGWIVYTLVFVTNVRLPRQHNQRPPRHRDAVKLADAVAGKSTLNAGIDEGWPGGVGCSSMSGGRTARFLAIPVYDGGDEVGG